MKILIIGSGLSGVTPAYLLARRGHEVTVVDRREGPGRETSFANGALLTPSMPEPWNAPGSWRVLLGSLGRSDAPLQLRVATLPRLAGWGVRFLKNSHEPCFRRNTFSNLRLSLYSLKVMESLRQETGVEYGRTALGTLRVFRDGAALDRATDAAERLSEQGLSFRRLSREQTVELEPALAPIAEQLAGSLHYPLDETGDAYRFCVALTEHARRHGVQFVFGTVVKSLEKRSGRVAAAVLADGQRLSADQYIVAAGSYSTPLLKRIRLELPVRPAKGYSVTFGATSGDTTLRIPVIDDYLHAVVVPMNGAVRAAGTAEFAGYDLSLPAARVENLMRLMQQVLPRAAFDPAAAKPWCGLRAMSVDGVPVIGATSIGNLFVNTGHGHLGWTMAAGSAQLLADLMSEVSPALDPAPYAFARFGAASQ